MKNMAVYGIYDMHDNERCVLVGNKFEAAKYLGISPNSVASIALRASREIGTSREKAGDHFRYKVLRIGRENEL